MGSGPSPFLLLPPGPDLTCDQTWSVAFTSSIWPGEDEAQRARSLSCLVGVAFLFLRAALSTYRSPARACQQLGEIAYTSEKKAPGVAEAGREPPPTFASAAQEPHARAEIARGGEEMRSLKTPGREKRGKHQIQSTPPTRAEAGWDPGKKKKAKEKAELGEQCGGAWASVHK